MKKKLLSLLLILCLTALPIAGASAAYAPKYTVYADTLFGLGLFQGDGISPDGSPSYRLGDGMTRAECIVMLLRLLGEEDAALAADRAAPFRDMTGHWAIRYVSYAYEKGYTSGTGADTFSPDDKASAKMYLTFLLRALGYNDKAGDFTYAAAYEKAAELGVCPKGAYTTDAAFYRDDCVYTSYLALRTPQKGSSETLLDALVAVGIRDITVVRGYRKECFDALLEKYPFLTLVDNDIYSKTNNISSVMAVLDKLDGCYLCEADLYITNPGIITKYQYASNILGAYCLETDDWSFQMDAAGHIINYQKGNTFCYNYYGISYWTQADSARLREDFRQVYGEAGGKDYFWEFIPLVLRKERYAVEIRQCRKSDIMEIDNYYELAQLDPTYRTEGTL